MCWVIGFAAGLCWFAALRLGFDRLLDERMSPGGKKLFRAFLMGSFFAMWAGLVAVLAELVVAGHWIVAGGLCGGALWLWRSILRKHDRRARVRP